GHSRLRQLSRLSRAFPSQLEQMGAIVALVGRLVDIASRLTDFHTEPSGRDRERMRRLAATIATTRADLQLRRVPQPIELPDNSDFSSAVPLFPYPPRT